MVYIGRDRLNFSPFLFWMGGAFYAAAAALVAWRFVEAV